MQVKNIISVIALTAIATFSHAQNEVDALRYSQTFFGGTARYTGMGGSFGALGADLSVGTSNPAGLGRFSQNQFSFTLNNYSVSSNTEFGGTTSNSFVNRLKVDNIGILFASNRESKARGWRHLQFAFTYNRLADFSSKRYYEGEIFNSLLDVFAAQAYGVDPSLLYEYTPFTSALAWDTYAIDEVYDTSGTVAYQPRLTNGNMYHKRSIQTRGGIGEYSLAFSGNYLNKLYIGGSINFQNTRYVEEYSHTEELTEPAGVSLRSFTYTWQQTTKGTGVNAKLGVIYAPIEDLRIGVAFHTPTIMHFKDSYRTGMNATHDTVYYEIPSNFEPQGEFSYRFASPLRAVFSGGYVVMKRLAINVEAELATYNKGNFRNSGDPMMAVSWETENQAIRNLYRTTVNLRTGLEFAFSPSFLARVGFAYYPSPYDKSVNNIGGAHYFYSAGIGYRWKKIFIDAGYRLHNTKIDYYAFNASDPTNLALITENKHQIAITLGLRF